MAAINNNPFEYWITNEDPKYNTLMQGVSEFIKNPGDKDIPVSQVFTEGMFTELKDLMKAANWNGVEETEARWNDEYKNRKVISEFIRDDLIGKKRLTSMPDRITNTISTTKGDVMRPTVMNCYTESLDSMEKWWDHWKRFMFSQPISLNSGTTKVQDMLQPIKQSKYPAISTEEAKISIPLQTMSLAIFDAILVHMLNSVSPGWHNIRDEICTKLNRQKNSRSIEILSTTYRDYDIQFLQEVGSSFMDAARKDKSLTTMFDVHIPSALDSKRDQNSIILLAKGKYMEVADLTREVVDLYNSKHTDANLPVMDGDLFVMEAKQADDGVMYLLASFHGDTNGLATKSVVTAVREYATYARPHHKLLFGMDANTYASPLSDQQGVTDFAAFYTALNMNTCYGPHPNPKNFTTFHARTYLQPQLNKAITYEEKDIKGDKNPKDFIMFFSADFDVMETRKDNTGRRVYVDNMVFPTLKFPSDHGITSTVLVEKKQSLRR
eukprot:CAMPEP_0185035902 /NCGR_PEP_ID=MMETSP1103-20130426/28024_1 /TAXON_ID=36769 /ORGANISM="Paraphysomonas bandaiensis, Strain Caron Lab Isolate" /LENGTH=494 /DNA_ID=CAMNT_0027573185 /DNA_START=216 /DNA_END=1700 /DNA_ORIENTATION=-